MFYVIYYKYRKRNIMNKYFTIDDESYKKFQAALILTGEEEDVVLKRLINTYIRKTFESAIETPTKEEHHSNNQVNVPKSINPEEQKQLFTNWFRNLTRNGRAYNPVTISGYTGRLEKACIDPIFSSISVKNLFLITDLAQFISVQNQIKNCQGFAEFDAKSHNGFTAALKKYEEFLKLQASGNLVITPSPQSHSYPLSPSIHRWTPEEDEICCKRFLQCYVINQSQMDATQFLINLAKEVPNVPEGSLRMKMQNIKHLTVQAGLKDTFPLKGLSQYSIQCEKAFRKSLKELNNSMY